MIEAVLALTGLAVAALVVMATAGHGRVARFMTGSITDKVVRAAPCPVLTLHPHDRAEEEAPNRAA